MPGLQLKQQYAIEKKNPFECIFEYLKYIFYGNIKSLKKKKKNYSFLFFSHW